MLTLVSTLRGTAMSMKKSGRRRPCMSPCTMGRVTRGTLAPVEVMTMSTALMAEVSSSKGTAVPARARAISWARLHVRLVT